MVWWIIFGTLAFLILVAFCTVYICFYRIFLTHRKPKKNEAFDLPDGEEYRPHHERMVSWIKDIRAMPHTEASIVSFDGLTLYGKYYEYEKSAPIELMIHGYRGDSERDLCGGVARAFALGHSALIIDHRACGKSDGRVISFGINESRDVHRWIEYIIQNIDKDAKIILTGVSMGAATAMICAGEDLPSNVVGVLADCGYTSAKDIIQKVMRDMKLPPKLFYPFAKIAARVLGRFDLEEKSPIEAMKKCRLPIIFIHGDVDDFVPHEMSVQNYHACASEHKKLVTVKGAGHALCYVVDSENYVKELKEFFEPFTR
ncbi:MAG: alpha/beta hydrolase [Clostridia bacterium]|nr:alpha/beta hydrolase [Clostridia bacterium]